MSEQPSIERAFFREAEDGSTVFFPWGLTHRGFRLGEDGERARASRAVMLWIGSTVAIGTWTAHALQPMLKDEARGFEAVLGLLAWPGAAFVLCCCGYALWVSRFTERLMPSDLEVSREERLREAASVQSPWKLAAIGVITAGLSGLVIWLAPQAWWMGALGIALGLGLLYWSVVLARICAE